MNIAVIGAGYAGLAATWHLLQAGHFLTVFDGGEGASHVSTGLLHPAPGKKAEPTWMAKEGMESAIELLTIAGEETFLRNGILRFASNEEQRKLFQKNEIFIPEGITVFSRKYLKGLKRACKGAKWIQHRVLDLAELKDFDQVILTVGAESLSWVSLPLKKTIGQCLVCRSKEKLQMSLLSNGHITPTEEAGIYLVGSTYEHTDKPDPKKALALLDQVARFYPAAKEFEVLDILSGTRIAPKVGYKPILEKIDPKTWIFTGLGSRGLIYHSLFAKRLALQLGRFVRRSLKSIIVEKKLLSFTDSSTPFT